MRKTIKYTLLLILIHTGLFTPSTNAQVLADPTDSLMLIEIYNALDGPNWNDAWDLGEQVYYWFGVTLDPESGKVNKLDLTQKNAVGDCPFVEFSDLHTLKFTDNLITSFAGFNVPNATVFSLRGNPIVDFVFPDLSNFPNLEELDLSQTGMTGGFPDVEFLSNLVIFRIQENELTGPVPDLGLPNLEELAIVYNSFTGELPNFSGIPNLKIFNGGYNSFEGALPLFDQIPLIEYLWLAGQEFAGEIPNFYFPNIIHLDLSNNDLTGDIPNFDNLPLVTKLHLNNNDLSGEIPNLNLPNVEQILLAHNNLTGEISDFDLPALTHLDLSYNELSGSIPAFGNLPALENLFLVYNNLTGSIPDFLTPNLSNITIIHNELSGPVPDFQTIEALEIFQISHNNITGPIPDLSEFPITRFYAQNTMLEGCYPLYLCDVYDVSLINNPGLPFGGSLDGYHLFCANYSSQFGMPCDDGDPNTIGETIQPDCNCATTNSFTNFVEGIVFADTIENCALDTGEIPLRNWFVTAVGEENTYYDVTDSLGQYKVYADSGTYELHFEIPNDYWEICPDIQNTSLDFNLPANTFYIDAPQQSIFDCPVLNVDISTPFLRRCFDNTYYLNYFNDGSVGAEDAYIEVTFDEFLEVQSSNPPWTSQDGQTFTFELGDVSIAEFGTIQIETSLNCDDTFLGQTHCVEARIFPDSICLSDDSLWDGSTIEVDAECREDSIQFFLHNVGENDMSMPLNYYIVIDDLIHMTGNFILPSGGIDSTALQTTGATFRLEADQAAFHPTNSAPSISVEGCINAGDPVSLGFVTIFPNDDADPFVSIDCQENVGAYDPNDKMGYPVGLGPNHLIDSTTRLDYKIRFQNTGTDTAFLVVIRDTLSEFLNPATIKMGAASHAYDWEILGINTLQIAFENIMLPDSNINEVQSHGFIKFTIEQQETNVPGTLIQNEAAIYFDFNEAVITNQTDHLVEDRLIVFDTLYTSYCNHWLYDEDTVIETQSNFTYYDLFVTNYITANESPTTIIDTFLVDGASFDSIQYLTDTSLVYSYPIAGNCDSLVIFNLDIISNVNEINSEAEVQIFPNPTSDHVYFLVHLELGQKAEALYLYNAMGQLIRQKSIQSSFSDSQQVESFNLEDLPKGVYTVRLLGTEIDWMGKIVKQ